MRKVITVAVLCGVGLACGACAGALSGATSSAKPPPLLAPVIRITDSIPAGAVAIGEVSGISCKNKVWDPDATEGNAVEILKRRAADAGADGISGVRFSSGAVNLITNCWASVTAVGTAYKTKR